MWQMEASKWGLCCFRFHANYSDLLLILTGFCFKALFKTLKLLIIESCLLKSFLRRLIQILVVFSYWRNWNIKLEFSRPAFFRNRWFLSALNFLLLLAPFFKNFLWFYAAFLIWFIFNLALGYEVRLKSFEFSNFLMQALWLKKFLRLFHFLFCLLLLLHENFFRTFIF